MFTVSFSSQSSPSCASFCHTFPLESSWWSIESHHFESHIWVTMKWFISYSQRFFFPWCECCRGEVHYNISFGVGASQIPRKIGVTHRGFCHGVYPWKGETNGWLVVWNMNFMTSLRVGMFFFNLTFTPSFFRGGVLPNHINNQPDGDFRWFFGGSRHGTMVGWDLGSPGLCTHHQGCLQLAEAPVARQQCLQLGKHHSWIRPCFLIYGPLWSLNC